MSKREWEENRDSFEIGIDIDPDISEIYTTKAEVGWYGMNFRYMPVLEWKWGYPVIILISILIVAGSLLFFKKKKWL